MMSDQKMYDDWIADRRAAKPPGDLTGRVMAAVESLDVQGEYCVSLTDRMNASPPARWAACVAAVLVGCLPLLYVAYVTHSNAF